MRGSAARGFSLAELLVVVAIIGVMTMVAMAGWSSYRKRTEIVRAAELTRVSLIKARMLSVYRSTMHFLVLNPADRKIEIYSDSTAGTPGAFDSEDELVSSEMWPGGVSLALPPGVTALANPLGGADLTAAWSLPDPDTTARWSTTLFGVEVVPTGIIQSAEASSQVILGGALILSDLSGQASCVVIRGQTGSARSYVLVEGNWKKL